MRSPIFLLMLVALVPLQISLAQVDPTAPEYECPYCDMIFPNKEMLDNHIQNAHTFICPYCSELFRSADALDSHIDAEHTYQCPYCDSIFVGDTAYNDHIAANHTYICPVCGDTLIGKNAYDSHMEELHTFECEYCDSVFTTAEELNEHIEAEHYCPYCEEYFEDSVALSEHIQEMHTYECPYCGETIIGQEEYNEHVSYNHICPHCSQTFPSRSELESHIATEHYFPCPICEYRAYSQEELSEHIYEQHRSTESLNERYLDRTGSISLGVRYMQFYDPIETDEPQGKLLFDSQLEWEPVAFGLAFNVESPPEESTMPDSEYVFFATSSVRLGALININRYINVGAGIGYSTTHIFETDEYEEGSDSHFSQYVAVDFCIGSSEDPSKPEDEEGKDSSGDSADDSYILPQFYIRPSIERTSEGWYPAVSAGIMGAFYTLQGN